MTSKIIWSTTEFLDGRNRSSLKIIAKLDLRLSFPMFWICGIEGASTRQTIEHFSNWFGNFEWAVKMLTKFVFYLVTLNNNATKSGFTCDLTLFLWNSNMPNCPSIVKRCEETLLISRDLMFFERINVYGTVVGGCDKTPLAIHTLRLILLRLF